jgi:hypothetical protein
MAERIHDNDVKELAAVRQQLESARDLARRLEKFEKDLEKKLLARVQAGDFNPSLMLDTKEKLVVTDWDKVWDYIYANKASSLVHKRLTDSAAIERLAAGEKIEGLDTVEVSKLKIVET